MRNYITHDPIIQKFSAESQRVCKGSDRNERADGNNNSHEALQMTNESSRHAVKILCVHKYFAINKTLFP